ncbi:hypothetical protein [Marininema halotolerans]|nr:hypothetical protein [Marininema halotolerans]
MRKVTTWTSGTTTPHARFDTRDAYSDASQDLGLAMDMATDSRYAFAVGNLITYRELDGHISMVAGVYQSNPVGDYTKGENLVTSTMKVSSKCLDIKKFVLADGEVRKIKWKLK